jgi:hypothetical protein
MYSPYQVLGISEGASEAEIESAYASLSKKLAPESFEAGDARDQASKCMNAIVDAYNSLTAGSPAAPKRSVNQSALSNETTHPRLGQMCVATGIISMEQLEEAVQEQIRSGLPLGEVLEDKQFLSRVQLDGLLLGQGLIDVDGERNDPVAQRLIALNLATLDMVLIAQMQMKWQENPSLLEAFVRHGWLAQEIADVLFPAA